MELNVSVLLVFCLGAGGGCWKPMFQLGSACLCTQHCAALYCTVKMIHSEHEGTQMNIEKREANFNTVPLHVLSHAAVVSRPHPLLCIDKWTCLVAHIPKETALPFAVAAAASAAAVAVLFLAAAAVVAAVVVVTNRNL